MRVSLGPLACAQGYYISTLRALAKGLGLAIAASLMQADTDSQGVGGGPPRNSVALIDRDGKLLYTYSKVHTG